MVFLWFLGPSESLVFQITILAVVYRCLLNFEPRKMDPPVIKHGSGKSPKNGGLVGKSVIGGPFSIACFSTGGYIQIYHWYSHLMHPSWSGNPMVEHILHHETHVKKNKSATSGYYSNHCSPCWMILIKSLHIFWVHQNDLVSVFDV